MAKSLVIEILGNAKQFGAELDKAAGKTRQMSKVAGFAGIAIAGGLAVGLDKAVKAAMEGQVSQTQLDQALRNTKQSVAAMKGPLEDAEAASRKLGFTDDDTRTALAKLEIATGSTKKSISELSVAENIARFKHVDLTAATKMLAMAQTGSQRAIKQLGLEVQKTTVKQDEAKAAYKDQVAALDAASGSTSKMTVAERELYDQKKNTLALNYATDKALAKSLDTQATSAHIIETVSEKVKGQGQAFADSAAGGMEQFHAQSQHLEESLGKALLPAMTQVADTLSNLTGFLADHTTTAKVLVGVLGTFAAALITVSVAAKVAAAGQVLLNVALDANPIGLVIIGLVALGAALVVAWQKSQTFRDIVTGTWDAIKTAGQTLVTFVTVTIPGAFKTALDWVGNNWPAIATIISGPFAPLVALATNAFGVRSALEGAFTKTANWVDGKVGDIADYVTNLPSRIGDFSKGLFNTVTGFIGDAGIGTWIYNKIGDFADFFSAMPGRVADAVKGKAGDLWDGVKHIFDKLPGFVKDALGIASPSKVFVQIGEAIIDGAIKGVKNKAGGLLDAIGSAFPAPKGTGEPGGGGQMVGTTGLVGKVLNALQYARQMGWTGSVTSGFRTYAEQASLYQRYLRGGPLAAKPGSSSHERGEAIDVTDYQKFASIMASAPSSARLNNFLGAADPVHFSVSGYATGGIVPGPIGAPQLAVVHGGETITPHGRGGGDTFVFQFPHYLGDTREIIDVVQREFLRLQSRGSKLGFAT